jgi:pimeloyl-ACP methyl ester carboxylesterase
MSQTAQRPARELRRRLLRTLLLLISIYSIVGVVVACLQRRMIYHPSAFSSQRVDQMAQAAGLERWKNPAGESIGMKRPSPRQPAEGGVLITYGNASDAISSAHYADAIQSVAAFDVFILEYPGYADRSGSPSQAGLFRAADEAFQFLPTNKPVYLMGESLGSGVAAYLAGTHPGKVAGMVLISPYNRLADLAQFHMPIFPVQLLLVDRFPSEDYLRNYHGPIAMVVDGHDMVIPEKFGLRLYNGYAGPKRLWEFPNGEHASILKPPDQFWKEVVEFWRINQSISLQQPV